MRYSVHALIAQSSAPSPSEWAGLTTSEWEDITAAVASTLTAVALIVGAWWAWRRFRRSPESRAKITLDVEPTWHNTPGKGQFVTVELTATNDGGRRWTLRDRRDDDHQDRSRIGCWWLSDADVEAGATAERYVNWILTPATRAYVLDRNVELRPKDTWRRSILFTLPDEARAARFALWMYVDHGSQEPDRIDAEAVAVRPEPGGSDVDTTRGAYEPLPPAPDRPPTAPLGEGLRRPAAPARRSLGDRWRRALRCRR